MSTDGIQVLLDTPTMSLRDVVCAGACRHKSAEECVAATHLVFAYRGVFVRHAGRQEAVADANQMVLFNADEAYTISHPVAGGDACLSLALADEALAELAPPERLKVRGPLAFDHQRRGLDAPAQVLAARLRYRLARGAAETLEGESLVLSLVRRALGERTSQVAAGSFGRQKLADRARLVLASDLARRWTLAEVAAEVGVSPIYLTQVFREVEGVPLYRYQLRLRLARALDLLRGCDDLTALGLNLGFSSHSHFTAAFRKMYRCTPAEIRRASKSG